MQPVARATTSDVIARLREGRDLTAGSAPWTLQFISLADAQFGAAWAEVELTGDEALAIVLPPHAGEPCRGDRLSLVADHGASVASAATTLRAMAEDYARLNPSCWRRIQDASTAPFSTLVLTTAPLDVDEFHLVERAPNAYYRLDGFHRLVGWAWVGRLTGETRLRAHVAGTRI